VNSWKAWRVRERFLGTGQTSQDYFAECFRKDEYADCAPDGTDQRDGGQVAAAISGADVSGLYVELRPGRPPDQ